MPRSDFFHHLGLILLTSHERKVPCRLTMFDSTILTPYLELAVVPVVTVFIACLRLLIVHTVEAQPAKVTAGVPSCRFDLYLKVLIAESVAVFTFGTFGI